MRDVLDHDEITKLLSRIMRGSRRVERSSDDWLAPIGMPRFKGPGGSGEPVLFSIDRDFDIEFDQSAQETTRVLALLLQSQLAAPEQADAHYVEREIMSAIGEVKSGAAKDKGLGQRLADRVAKRFARSVTVVPVGGLDFLGVEEVAKLRDRVLLGPFNDATESVFDSFAKEFTGHSFHFTSDVWWTENVLAFRSEPALFEDGPPGEGIGLIAVAIDSVDVGAGIRAMELVEALLGAMWIIDQWPEPFASAPPWILGTPSTTEYPREPTSHEDGSLPVSLIQVSTRATRVDAIDFDTPQPHVDVAAVLAQPTTLVDLVARAEAPVAEQGLARRLAAACRLARLAGQDSARDVEILHLVVALEALVSDHATGPGVTARFVKRVLALLPADRRDAAALEALYNLRSEVGHQGFSADSRTRVSKAAAFGQNTLYRCILAFAELVDRHQFRSESDLLAWLDRTAPDAKDPFA
ncbi:hypothetical protein [Nocardioides nitrophenolicus]|uniref:hypothetical protein n=1 Tax=Nocardioides nitrophenolicus TaxID=60489 RepID=UPI0019564CAE|nr:hypothetical protein [Nocardioides nitrophenolicus]MBM7518618.1 hypothetical protein [Nocardioides nitrophenolicus]